MIDMGRCHAFEYRLPIYAVLGVTDDERAARLIVPGQDEVRDPLARQRSPLPRFLWFPRRKNRLQEQLESRCSLDAAPSGPRFRAMVIDRLPIEIRCCFTKYLADFHETPSLVDLPGWADPQSF